MRYYYRRVIPFMTILLIVANVVCYLYEMKIGLTTTTARYAMYQGALQSGQYLRIVTSGFMHFDIFHLLSNMLCLGIYGMMLERSIGSVKFSIIYAVSLLVGGIAINFVGGNGLHMGASGAIWGLMTATLIYHLKSGISPYYSLRVIIINLLYTFGAGVSWQGHIGGGIGGLLTALALFKSRPMYSQSYVGYTDQSRRVSERSWRRKSNKKDYVEYPDDGQYHP